MASKGKHGGKGKGGGSKGGGGGSKGGAGASGGAQVSTGPFKWDSWPVMPTKRVYSSAVELDDILYVIGGSDQRGQTLDAFECYNTKKKKWMRLLNMPNPRAQPAVVTVGSKIVVIGGVGSDAQPVNFVDIYDVEQKKWLENVRDMDEKLQGVSAVVHNGKVIVIGGMKGDTNPVSISMVLDIEQNIWLKLPDMPTARYAAGTFLKGDKLYLLGGRIGKKACQAFEMLDLASQPTPEWKILPELPIKLVFSCYLATDTHLYRLGGLHETQRGVPPKFDDSVSQYSIEEGKWNELPNMSNKRGDFSAALVGDKLVVVGGIGPSEKPHTDAEFFDTDKNSWVFIDHCSTMRGSGTCIVYQNRMVIIGGFTPQGLTGAVDALSSTS
ncbi:uncharacterized protein [Amphiura filiformis]|uniref:uncharacterized protein n=1 Tax=Amphiura filiformis TaxID=82378 RepID=UPI003B21C15D